VRELTADRHGRYRCRGATTGEWRASVADDPSADWAGVEVRVDQTTRLDLSRSPAGR
jgi:hypothetical protein